MVATVEIPKHYTASPSSHIGTPHLTINKEATIDLDSSNAFEGTAIFHPVILVLS
jgi:S-adenosylmethionine decarboxylase